MSRPQNLSRRTALALLAPAGLALAGCTGGVGRGGDSVDDLRLAKLPKASIVEGGDPVATSIAVSKALLTKAPAAVIADEAKAAAGAQQAISLGLPLLFVGADPKTVTEELKRLGATAVLAVGDKAAALKLDGITVAKTAEKLPKFTKAKAAKTLVLTSADLPAKPADFVAATAAAAATGLAIGATVDQAPGGDPRGSKAAVEAMAKTKPTAVLAVGTGFGTEQLLTTRLAATETGIQLPGGGQRIAPGKMYIAMYGHPGTPSLGVLGEQDLDATVKRVETFAKPYRTLTTSTVVPTFEIIASVATGSPGPSGTYSNAVSPDFFEPWIKRAEHEGIYCILDLQAGRANILDQAKYYEKLLKYSNVGLAIDPEWKLKPGERPLVRIGQVDAVTEVNPVLDWLAKLVADNKLPQKAVVLHQFQRRMILNREKLNVSHDELQIIIHVDGNGVPDEKLSEYANVGKDAPKTVLWGWKNFIDEDRPMWTPERTMTNKPVPTMVSYQ